jgi:hypothetical protein
VKPNYQELTAAAVLAFAVVIGIAVLPSRVDSLGVKHAKTQARLPVEGATFVDRWDVVKEIDHTKMSALEAWLHDHGVIGNAIVGEGN